MGILSASQVVLITGCSSGLGFALARLLYPDQRYRLVISARKIHSNIIQDNFMESDRVMIRAMDVTTDSQMGEVVNEVNRSWGGVDVLINNAGIAYRSVIEHMDLESELHQLKTNYLGPMALTRLVLPTMREKRRGHIINVSSVSGMMAMPTMGSYSASKHALEGASEALWYEMRPFGVSVSLIQPGFVNSSSFSNTYMSKKARMSDALDGPYSDYYRFIAPFIGTMMKRSFGTPESIAGQILRLIEARVPPLWVPVTLDAKFFAYLRKLLPRTIFHRLMFLMLPGSRSWGNAAANEESINLYPSTMRRTHQSTRIETHKGEIL